MVETILVRTFFEKPAMSAAFILFLTDTYHWRAQDEEKRFDWEAGDVIYSPPNTIHQHFNANPDKPVRLISAINRICKYCGLNDLEQIEDAPEYDPEVALNAQTLKKYLGPG